MARFPPYIFFYPKTQVTEWDAYILSLSQGNEITCLYTCKSDVEGLVKYYDWGEN